jgi:hypothetical protein
MSGNKYASWKSAEPGAAGAMVFHLLVWLKTIRCHWLCFDLQHNWVLLEQGAFVHGSDLPEKDQCLGLRRAWACLDLDTVGAHPAAAKQQQHAIIHVMLCSASSCTALADTPQLLE